MYQYILIAYATATNSTPDVASTIGEILRTSGFFVDVKPVEKVSSLADYDALVIGSAVQYGTWLPEAVEFIKQNQEALIHIPVALFCVHIQNTGDDPKSVKKRLSYLDNIRPYVNAIDEGYFAGRFNQIGAERLLPKWIVRFVPNMDHRNWLEIREWASKLSLKLEQAIKPDFLPRELEILA